MAKFVIALDQGTTSSRAVVFDASGKPIAASQQPFQQHYPQPGWVEHNPFDILQTQLFTLREAMANASATPADIAGIGITNQRETTVVWDARTGMPFGNAIVWQCRRTSGMVDELCGAPDVRERIVQTTGLVPDAYFSASKVKWILDNVEGARAAAETGHARFGTVDSWLIYNLTGGAVHATDYTNASRTMLFDIHAGAWDEELCALFDVPMSMLPDVRPSAGDFGTTASYIPACALAQGGVGLQGGTLSQAGVGPQGGADSQGGALALSGNLAQGGALDAEATLDVFENIPAGIPLCGVAGDQQAALFGHLCTQAGQAKNTYGTGCFLLMHTGHEAVRSRNNLVTTIAASAPGTQHMEYALEGSVFMAGALIQWVRDELGLIANSAESEELARSVDDSAGVYVVPAFTGLGAPYWDAEARGAIYGLTRGAGKAHIVRACLEALAYQTADLMRAMEDDCGIRLGSLAVDGGACRNDFLMQFQADILDTAIERPANIEATAAGAAYLAGLAAGFWESVDALQSLHTIEARFNPALDQAKRTELLAGWKQAVNRTRSGL